MNVSSEFELLKPAGEAGREMNDSDEQGQPVPRPWHPRFSITAMLLLMLVVSVTAAGASYLVRAADTGRASQLAFILITLAAPLLLVVIVSVARALLRRR